MIPHLHMEREDAQYQVDQRSVHMRIIALTRRQRLLSFYLFWAITLLPMIRSYFLRNTLGLLIPEWRKQASVNFLKFHIQKYMSTRGITSYLTAKQPDHLEKPSLIFTSRIHDLGSLFAMSKLPFQVIVPVAKQTKESYKLQPMFPFHTLKKSINRISYPDGPIEKTLPMIRALLENNYTVLVNLNDAYIDPRFHARLPISSAIRELLDHESIYFLNSDGLHFIGAASQMANPITIRYDLVDKAFLQKTLPKPLKEDPEAILLAGVRCLGFEDYDWVS